MEEEVFSEEKASLHKGCHHVKTERGGIFHIAHKPETLSQSFLKSLANIEGKSHNFPGLYDSLCNNRRQQGTMARMWSLHLVWVLLGILRNMIWPQFLLLLIGNEKPLFLKGGFCASQMACVNKRYC